jgi:hypothetical protein
VNLSRARCVVLRCVLSALVGLICALVACAAWAEPVRVVVLRPEPPGPLLEEALIRIRGELSTVGLGVEVRSPAPDELEAPPSFGPLDYGVVELRVVDSQIEIRAHAPGLDSPVVQTADPEHPGINAEVIAIRTVEALRAAMIQYARRKKSRNEALPKPVSGFTKLEEPEAEEAPKPAPPPPTPREEPRPRGSLPDARRSSAGLEWSLWLGGNALVDFPSRVTSLGAQGAFFVGRSFYRVGLLADRTALGGRIDEFEGQVSIRRTALTGRFDLELDLVSTAFAFGGVGAGAADYRFETVAAPGFVSSDGHHLSALLSAELGLGAWFFENGGAFASARLDVATDAPELFFAARDIARLDQPSLVFSAGVMVGRR